MIRTYVAALVIAAGLPVPAAQAQRSDTLRIGLAEAVAYVLKSSDENKLALLNIDIADAGVTVARAPALPQVRFNGQYQQVLINARADIVGSVFGQSYTYTGTMAATQPLFQGLRLFSATRAASRVKSAVRFDASETRGQLAVAMQRSYLNALYLATIAELQARNLALSSERLRQVEQLAGAGRSSRYDVLRARVDRANIEPLALQAASDREIAVLDVKRLMDIPAERPVVLSTALDTAAVRQIAAAIAADDAADEVRFSVRSAELNLAARRDLVQVARADFFPQVTAFFNWGYLALPGVNGLPDRLGQTSTAFCPAGTTGRICQNNGFFADRNFGLTVSWAVLDGLRAKGNVDLATAQRRVAEVTLHQQREAAAIDLARAHAEFDRSRAAYAARAENASEAEEAFQLATLRFNRGLATQVEVTDAQVALLIARSTEARAVYDVYLAAADLARVRGRPIPLPNGSTVPAGSNSGLNSRASTLR
jgi:outer membrane protein TolC